MEGKPVTFPTVVLSAAELIAVYRGEGGAGEVVDDTRGADSGLGKAPSINDPSRAENLNSGKSPPSTGKGLGKTRAKGSIVRNVSGDEEVQKEAEKTAFGRGGSQEVDSTQPENSQSEREVSTAAVGSSTASEESERLSNGPSTSGIAKGQRRKSPSRAARAESAVQTKSSFQERKRER